MQSSQCTETIIPLANTATFAKCNTAAPQILLFFEIRQWIISNFIIGRTIGVSITQ
jgi:hypothetical protein